MRRSTEITTYWHVRLKGTGGRVRHVKHGDTSILQCPSSGSCMLTRPSMSKVRGHDAMWRGSRWGPTSTLDKPTRKASFYIKSSLSITTKYFRLSYQTYNTKMSRCAFLRQRIVPTASTTAPFVRSSFQHDLSRLGVQGPAEVHYYPPRDEKNRLESLIVFFPGE